MPITTEYVILRVNCKNITQLKSYFKNDIKTHDNISLSLQDITILFPNRKINVECICDKCNKKFITFICYIHNNITLCRACKTKHTNLEKYGVENVMHVKEIKDKIKQTNLERYGFKCHLQNKDINEKRINTCLVKYNAEYPLQSKIIQAKIKQTNLEKYGVENPYSSKEIREKIKQINLERYGVENPYQSEVIKDKIKQTNLERYGVDHIMKNKHYSNKATINANKTLFKNNTAPCSQQQRYIYNLFDKKICKLNFPVDRLLLDIAFPKEMIYIEYDGGGHNLSVKCKWSTKEEFNKREINRQYYLKYKGWKIIRILSNNDTLPSSNNILEIIQKCKQYLLTTNHTWINIDLNDNKIKCMEFVKDIKL